jgi:phosphatidylglycerol:prolipoprotein diacylglycerol transferase
MCPELFHIGDFPVRAYGVMLAISFLVGVFYIERVTKRDGLRFDTYLIIAYLNIAAGVIGARLAYVLFHLDEFSGRWEATFNPFAGGQYGIAGLNMQGGVILAVIVTWLFCRAKEMSVLQVYDYFAPTVGLGLGITRIGCFLNGCCFCTPTVLPWGVAFPDGSMPHAVFGELHLHPSQIYSSAYGIVLFLLLHHLLKRRRFDGQVVAVLFMIEAVFRYAIEYVRYYESAMHFDLLGMHPTYNQIMSIALFVLGLVIYIWGNRRRSLTLAGA